MDSNHKEYDNIKEINIEDEMTISYRDYAMSVIVSRALPDVRDGLKPVHRRILYAMSELNLDPSKPYKKSARITGDTMGKYHPHGDTAIYDAMVRMAQDFSMRHMLVDGHGNFGSIDGYGAAAARYTEARLSPISMKMLEDLNKNTVDFTPNYTEEFEEPTVLPSRFPNLLVNGSSGIAVGMATNIPPHNLNEVIDGVIKIIDNYTEENRETDIEELMEIITAPDFPTGGNILGKNGIRSAHLTGRGRVIMRAKADIDVIGTRNVIIVHEIPYQINKSKLIERIAGLVREKRVDGISDIRDESDRNGMRIVIELKKDANPNVVLNNLFKYSQLQETFGVIMIALVNKEPKVLNLKEILTYYLNHQTDVETRRIQFDLNKAEKRAHILEGLIIALTHIDEVLKLIRSSKDVAEAKEKLCEAFELSDEQATAIVDMRFRTLTGLEREKLEKELSELLALISELNALLQDEHKLYNLIKENLLEIKNKFGEPRRTNVIADYSEIDIEDLIDDEMNVITMTRMDYIKRILLDTYKSQHRGGKGIIGIQTREEDIVSHLFVTNTHSHIFFFTNLGKVYRLKAYEIPEVSRTARGTAIVNLLNLDPNEKIASTFTINDDELTDDKYLMMVTKKGVVKKTMLESFVNIRANGLIALNIREDDELIDVLLTNGSNQIFIATNNGMGIKFEEKQIRPMGRTAMGVRGIRLRGKDNVIGAAIVDDESTLLFVSEYGYGKRTKVSDFTLQRRGGIGSRSYRITDKTGELVSTGVSFENEELMIISSEGLIIRLRVNDINVLGRVTSGVKLINLDKDVTVESVAKITEEDLEAEEFDHTEEILNAEENSDEDENKVSDENTDEDKDSEENSDEDENKVSDENTDEDKDSEENNGSDENKDS